VRFRGGRVVGAGVVVRGATVVVVGARVVVGSSVVFGARVVVLGADVGGGTTGVVDVPGAVVVTTGVTVVFGAGVVVLATIVVVVGAAVVVFGTSTIVFVSERWRVCVRGRRRDSVRAMECDTLAVGDCVDESTVSDVEFAMNDSVTGADIVVVNRVRDLVSVRVDEPEGVSDHVNVRVGSRVGLTMRVQFG
jgi:hypothetical protein